MLVLQILSMLYCTHDVHTPGMQARMHFPLGVRYAMQLPHVLMLHGV